MPVRRSKLNLTARSPNLDTWLSQASHALRVGLATHYTVRAWLPRLYAVCISSPAGQPRIHRPHSCEPPNEGSHARGQGIRQDPTRPMPNSALEWPAPGQLIL